MTNLSSGSTKQTSDYKIDQQKLLQAGKFLIEAIEGTHREGTERTPERIARDWGELFEGYNYNVKDILNRDFDAEGYDEMVIVDTEFISTCEHHILPFVGKAWVGYIPDKRIVGLDKLIKLVWMFSRRLQNQERITKQVAEAIEEVLHPVGVMVVLKAWHGCIRCRGTNAKSETVTSVCKGAFRESAEPRNEFLDLIRLQGE